MLELTNRPRVKDVLSCEQRRLETQISKLKTQQAQTNSAPTTPSGQTPVIRPTQFTAKEIKSYGKDFPLICSVNGSFHSYYFIVRCCQLFVVMITSIQSFCNKIMLTPGTCYYDNILNSSRAIWPNQFAQSKNTNTAFESIYYNKF